jgi:formylglycine-generating enzyme required for sulfatase activity
VYRFVPEEGDEGKGLWDHHRWTTQADGSIDLPAIKLWSDAEVIEEMVFVDGGTFTMGDDRWGPDFAPQHPHQVDSFYVDPFEVTVAMYRDAMGHVPDALDAQPGEPDPQQPVTFVSYGGGTLAYAEMVGKRLITEAEYEYLATNKGATRFPWGDDEKLIAEWKLGPVSEPAYDVTTNPPGVYGLYSNAAEWCDSWLIFYHVYSPSLGPDPFAQATPDWRNLLPICRVVRGGPSWFAAGDAPATAEQQDPRYRFSFEVHKEFPAVSFRCTRSPRPRYVDVSVQRRATR